MKISSLTREDVLRTLVTSESGLTEQEAFKRLSESGPNEIREIRKTPLTVRFLRQFTHFLAILLWIGAGLAFFSEHLHPGEGMVNLGFAILGVIVINAIFTFIQEYRAEKALEELRKLLPFSVRTVRDGLEQQIPGREVVHGDVILLSEGDKVPADARLIEGSLLRVNNAPLTGESDSVLRTQEPYPGELHESPNIVFAGTTVTSGSGKAVVFATGMGTEFGRIAHLTSSIEAGLTPLQREIMRATRLIAVIAASVGLVFFVLGFFIERDFWDNFIFAIGITVALIPEGMLPTVTLALAMGSQRMAKRKALIKRLNSVETLGSVTVICTDKTGTLTQNRMSVAEAWVEGRTTGVQELEAYRDHMLLTVARLCNNARFVDGTPRGDPTEVALLQALPGGTEGLRGNRFHEIPFDSDRKRMTTITRVGDQIFALSKGAVETLLPLCTHALRGGSQVVIDEAGRQQITEAAHLLMGKGLRVLAFAFRQTGDREVTAAVASDADAFSAAIEKDLVFAGLIGLEDPPRPEVQAAIEKCHEAGVKVIMITGDGSRTAAAIAREIGLVRGEPVIIEGGEFVQMTDGELREKLSAGEIIFARMTPKHKLRVVSILMEEGERVAVTGDGVNDAPALKKADIGISMGIAGTDVAKEASDMILLDDNFATIVNAIEEGRAIYENIRKFITYIFASNIPEAVPYLCYILLGIPLPLTIMQILAVDLGTDMLPALALGAEKPTPGIMSQPPRDPHNRLLDFPLLGRAYLFLGPIEAASCMFGYFWVLLHGGWTWGTVLQQTNPFYMQATTACLTGIVVTQAANVFACRTSRESVFAIRFFSNPLIFGGIIFELLLIAFIIYHPWGNAVFATAPLSPSVWAVLLPFSALLLLAEEVRKYVLRHGRPRADSSPV